MSDPIGPRPDSGGEPTDAPDSSPARVDVAAAATSDAVQARGADSHGLVAFIGVLALVLLFVGAVGAASRSGGTGSDGVGPVMTPGTGNAYGQQKQAEKAQRRAERQAEKLQRKQAQLERKARRDELKEQRRQSGAMGPRIAEMLTEQTGTLATQTAADGATVYVLQTSTGSLVLDVGPPRYWGEGHPLAPFVGQSITVSGIAKPWADAFAVFAIGDQVIRGVGRPPWAGGWKADGQKAPMTSPSPTPTPTP